MREKPKVKERSQVLNYKFGTGAFDIVIYPKAVDVVNILKQNGHTAFFVGGCVRDVLLGSKPKEIDITTSATPEEIQKLFKKTYPVGAKFGVCVVAMGDHNFEVSTFRKDADYEDGRRPSFVTFSDPKEDANRRDFTINSIFWDPIESKLYDYVGGLDDLNAGVIKAVGDPIKRFEEDRLRILRCARFVSQLGFAVDRKTYEALFQIKDPLKGVSPERLRDELEKILMTKKPSIAINLLNDLEILKIILPELSLMKGVPQPKEFHKYDVWGHTMFALDFAAKEIREEEKTKELMWALLLHDVGKPATITMPKDKDDRIRFNGHDNEGAKQAEAILTRLKLPNKTIKKVCYIVQNHMRVGKADGMRKSRLKMLLSKDTFKDELNLLYVDIKASHEKMGIYEFLKKEYQAFIAENRLPTAIVDGKFLIEMGYKPSPLFNKIIKKAYEAQLEGSFSDNETAKKFVKSISKKN